MSERRYSGGSEQGGAAVMEGRMSDLGYDLVSILHEKLKALNVYDPYLKDCSSRGCTNGSNGRGEAARQRRIWIFPVVT